MSFVHFKKTTVEAMIFLLLNLGMVGAFVCLPFLFFYPRRAYTNKIGIVGYTLHGSTPKNRYTFVPEKLGLIEMSFAVCRMQKMKSHDLKGIQFHN